MAFQYSLKRAMIEVGLICVGLALIGSVEQQPYLPNGYRIPAALLSGPAIGMGIGVPFRCGVIGAAIGAVLGVAGFAVRIMVAISQEPFAL